MRGSSATETMAPGSSRACGAWMSKSARRRVRQAVQLAAELGNVYSVQLQGVVWTLRHPEKQQEPKSKSADTDKGCVANTRRAEKSAARLAEFQTALRFRIGTFFRRWSQSIRLRPTPQALPPPPILPLPLPPPKPTTTVAPQQPLQQPPSEQMDDDRAPKRAPSTPLAADSPATPRAKRTLQLPPGLPPPSIPPSPPSSTSTPPPSIPPSHPSSTSISSPQRLDRADLVGQHVGEPESSAASSPSAPVTEPERVLVPRKCEDCKGHVTDGWLEEMPPGDLSDPIFICERCYWPGSYEGVSFHSWKATKTGLRCKACSRVLPWLYHPNESLCGRCSR